MTGISSPLSSYSSPMYSDHLSSILSFSIMIVPSFASTQVIVPLPRFFPVTPLIWQCMRLVLWSVSSCSISWHCSFSRASFASMQACLIYVCNKLYRSSSPLASRLWFILCSIGAVIHICLAVMSTSGSTCCADSVRAFWNLIYRCSTLSMMLIPSMCSEMCRRNCVVYSSSVLSKSNCNFLTVFVIFIFLNFTLIVAIPGTWSLAQSAPGYPLTCRIELQNLSLIVI